MWQPWSPRCTLGVGACRHGPRPCPMIRLSPPTELWDQKEGCVQYGALSRPTASSLSSQIAPPHHSDGKLRPEKGPNLCVKGSWQEPHKHTSLGCLWFKFVVFAQTGCMLA